MSHLRTATIGLLFALAPLSAHAQSNIAQPQACWANTTTRGAGTIPTTCDTGKQFVWGLCYDACNPGYQMQTAGICSAICPANYTDTGALCEFTNGPALIGNGCSGNCPTGYTNTGCVCDAITFAKDMYSTAVGTMPYCPSGQSEDAGLCYTSCPPSSNGVGPVCWATCPPNFPVACGAMCTTTDAECGMETAQIVTAVAGAVVSIVSLGTAHGATEGATAAEQTASESTTAALETADSTAADAATESTASVLQRIKAFGKQAKEALQPAIDAYKYVLKPDYAGAQLGYVLASNSQNGGTTTNWALIDATLQAGAAVDPTGLVNVAAQLTKPICGSTWGGVGPAPWLLSGAFFPYAPSASILTCGQTGVYVATDVMSVLDTSGFNTSTLMSQTYTASSGSSGVTTVNGMTANVEWISPAMITSGDTLTLSHTATLSNGQTYSATWTCPVPLTPTAVQTTCTSTGADSAIVTYQPNGQMFIAVNSVQSSSATQVQLSVTVTGTGGKVHGGGCSAFNNGTCQTTLKTAGSNYTLTAAPDAGYFPVWTGPCQGNALTCTIQNVTACGSVGVSFTNALTVPLSFTFPSNATGAGMLVTVSPAQPPTGTTCTSTASSPGGPRVCNTTVPAGSGIYLTPIIPSGFTFTGWTGLCAGTTTPMCSTTLQTTGLSTGVTMSPSP